MNRYNMNHYSMVHSYNHNCLGMNMMSNRIVDMIYRMEMPILKFGEDVIFPKKWNEQMKLAYKYIESIADITDEFYQFFFHNITK